MADKNPKGQRTYQRKARNIFIHKPMQREFVFVVVSLLIVSSLGIGFVVHNTLHETALDGGFRFAKESPYEVLSHASYHLMVRVILILFATLLVLAFFSIFFLHRVAGPVYRFHQVFLRINDGDLPAPIRLREGDFFAETAMEINRLMNRLQFEKTRTQLLQQKVDELLSRQPGGEIARCTQELKALLCQEHVEKG